MTPPESGAPAALSRRALLRRGGVLALGLVAAGSIAAVPSASAASRPLTATALSGLRGRSVLVEGDGWQGTARVVAVRGNNGDRVKERSFQLDLRGDRMLPVGGAVVRLRHSDVGVHDLYFSPDRDRRTWVAVVQDLGEVRPSRRGASRG